MKSKKIIFFTFLILGLIMLSSCKGDKEIERLSVTGGLKTEYYVGEALDFSSLSLVAIYNDGTTENLTAENVSISPVDTSKIGDHPLKISYNGISISLSITVKAKPLDPSDPTTPIDPNKTIITAVSFPESLALLEANKKDFINKDYGYVVGDDNEFFLTLKLSVYTAEGEKLNVSSYTSVSEIYLDGALLVGDDLTKYVSIDEMRNAFDFTEEAIGKSFTIKTRPQDVPQDRIADMTKSLNVQIVDGYNIYKAYELNYVTNSTFAGFMEIIPGETRTQAQVVDDFLLNEKNTVRPTNISSIVLHGNLSVKPTDIPSEYFVNNDRTQEFYDDLSVFYRDLTDTEAHFAIHGNYFAIYTYELPTVINEQTGSYADLASSSQVFRFSPREYYNTIYFDHTKYTTNINNLMLLGNDPTSDNLDVVEKSMRGLSAIRSETITLNINNTKIQCYYIAVVALKDYHTVNVDQSIFYNQFQQHFFIVSYNNIQADYEEPILNYPAITLNVTRSHISGSGAPAIITQTENPSYNCNKYCSPTINISADTHIESWFSGDEAFFKYLGIGSLLTTQIKGIDRMLNKYNSSILKEETRIVDGKPKNVKLMNVICFNLPLPDLDNGYDSLYNDLIGKTNINGKLTIGDTVVMDMDNYVINGKPSNFGNPTISDLKEKDFSYNVLAKPDGSVGYTSAGSSFQVVTGDISAKSQNDYIVAYYYSLAIVFANYHPI